MAPDIIHLFGKASSVMLELVPGRAPLWRYWGARLPDGTLPPATLAQERPVPSFSLDTNVALSIFPTFGLGFYGAPALLAHRAGKDFAQDFTACETIWRAPHTSVTIRLIDDVAQLRVEIDLDLNPDSDVLSICTTLTNLAAETLDVQSLSAACLPLPPEADKIVSFTGRHNHEFGRCEDTLSRATWLRENRRGLTSHANMPYGLVKTPNTRQEFGPVYGAQLAWSGNQVQRIDACDDGGFCWQWGEWLAPGEVRLEQGETLCAPVVLASFSQNGLNGLAQNFHQAMRRMITWPSGQMRPRPVHFNTWEGVYFDLNEAALKDMAAGAAKLGVERFVLDDGWFHARRNDRAGLGDWWVDSDVFPNGLGPLAQHVVDLGMEFGLWVEPEMVNPDSDLYRAHPDWVLHISGRPALTARNQLVLDLTRPEAFDYIHEKLNALLADLPITYLKWDHNRDLTAAGSLGLPAYRRQVAATYRLLAALRKDWPEVEIEACAGGGGRIDAGILAHTHRFWTSDCIDAVSRVAMQQGFLQFFPPEVMGSHIGASPAHATGRGQAMPFRAGVALMGHLGIELDPRCLDDTSRATIKTSVELYKSWRHVLHGTKVWQGRLRDAMTWVAQGDCDEMIVSVLSTAPGPMAFAPRLKLPFLDPNRAYQLTVLAADKWVGQLPQSYRDALTQGTLEASGAWLVHAGLALPPMQGESALTLHVKARLP